MKNCRETNFRIGLFAASSMILCVSVLGLFCLPSAPCILWVACFTAYALVSFIGVVGVWIAVTPWQLVSNPDEDPT
jgi:hypothetical protein